MTQFKTAIAQTAKFSLLALALVSVFQVEAGDVRRAVRDSTGVQPGVAATMVMPAPGVSRLELEAETAAIKGDTGPQGGVGAAGTTGTMPADAATSTAGKLVPVTVQAGPHVPSATDQVRDGYFPPLSYYQLDWGYPQINTPIFSASSGFPSAAACAAGTAGPSVHFWQGYVGGCVEVGDSGMSCDPGRADQWYVCERTGTRTMFRISAESPRTFVAAVALTRAQIQAAIMTPGDWGVDARGEAPNRACQAYGYTAHVSGTVGYDYQGRGCHWGEWATVWKNGVKTQDYKCYKYLMTNVACY